VSKPKAGLEAVVIALASQCDGACRRDGRGFSRADAQEGARLAALASSGLPWSASDAKRALEMAARHPVQAAALMSGGDEKLQRALAAALREGKLPPLNTVEDAAQKVYSLASVSSGGRNVNFWRMSWIEDLGGFLAALKAISGLRHGQRRIRVVRNKAAEMTMNGARKRTERWEVPFNGTTLPHIVKAARDYGFTLDPAVEAGPDPLVDRLRRYSKACWLREEGSGKKTVKSAVFDLDKADPDFSKAVKEGFKSRFSCSPSDDWNWIIEWGPETKDAVRDLARRFGFAADPAMRD